MTLVAHETLLPEAFFTKILPRIGNLEELRLVLCLLRLTQQTGEPIPLSELRRSAAELGIWSDTSERGLHRLRTLLHFAVQRGTLVEVTSGPDPRFVPAFAEYERGYQPAELNSTTEGRALRETTEPVQTSNIFRLYEEHIGPLTAIMADRLRDAERMYPRSWIEDAILKAVHYNRRNWRYIETILVQREGTASEYGTTGRHP